MRQFNTSEENAMSQFNTQVKDSREKFEAQMGFAVEQSNAVWRRSKHREHGGAKRSEPHRCNEHVQCHHDGDEQHVAADARQRSWNFTNPRMT